MREANEARGHAVDPDAAADVPRSTAFAWRMTCEGAAQGHCGRVVIRPASFGTRGRCLDQVRGAMILLERGGRSGRQKRPKGDRPMATNQMLKADAFGVLPTAFILLMLILALLGIVAHAAAF